MANPFLMDDDLDGGDMAANPFLMQSEPDSSSDNPFGATTTAPVTTGASNPFAFGGDDLDPEPEAEPEAEAAPLNDLDPAMSFFGTTIEAEDDALSLKSAAEDSEPHAHAQPHPPPPPRPQAPPQSTQDLISTVSSQLDETSSELLGRIPATRSPSPVSMRDLHSPSPTPDSGLADLLDVSVDSGSSGPGGQVEADLMGNGGNGAGMVTPLDNPFAVPTALPNIQAATPLPASPVKQPPRPPPPRPAPPRPSPPGQVVAPAPQRPPPPHPVAAPAPAPAPAPAAEADDLLDMFGTTTGKPAKPPPPKSKEDILSLFEQPAAPPAPKPDLLHDDLPEVKMAEDQGQEEASASPEDDENPDGTRSQDEPIFTSLLTRPDESTHDISSQPQAATIAERQAMHMTAPPETASRQRAPTPDIEITTVEDLPRSDDEEEPEVKKEPEPEPEAEPEPEQEPLNEPEKDIIAEPEPQPELELEAETETQPEAEPQPEPEQMDTGLDFPLGGTSGLASGQLSANPFASPEEEEEPAFAPVPAVVGNIFSVDPEPEPEPAVTQVEPPPPVVASYASNIFAVEQPDEFDAFSAKFDSVKKDNISILDGFGGSGAITPTGGDGKLILGRFYGEKSLFKIGFLYNSLKKVKKIKISSKIRDKLMNHQ